MARKWIAPIFDLDELDFSKTHKNDEKTLKTSNNKYSLKKLKTSKESAFSSKDVMASERQLHGILHKISERASFLVEDRLLQILDSYTDEEKCLVKIENIFSVC